MEGPIKLEPHHNAEKFDCGSDPLNVFIAKYAILNQQNRSSVTYVVLDGQQDVIAYYSLAFSSVAHTDATEPVRKGLPRYPVPVLLIAKLAVVKEWQGKGLGKALIKDALQRTINASSVAGLRAVLVHAKDDNARNNYESIGFQSSPSNPKHLMIVIDEIERILSTKPSEG